MKRTGPTRHEIAERIIVALDHVDPHAAVALGEVMVPLGVRWLKVGLGLWICGGRPVVERLRGLGARIFLDLKLHDIPHQVHLASRAAADLGVDLVTVHAAGGPDMIRAAVAGAGGGATGILAVSVLTSLRAQPGQVAERVAVAHAAGAAGVVCSPLEVASLWAGYPPPFLLVTPGVRPPGAATHDQLRVATPEAAIAAGTDLLVIGRPITQAPDPVRAFMEILEPWPAT